MIPGSANPLLLASAAAAGDYQIQRSLRFNSSDSAYCERVVSTAGDRDKWTLSFWIKRAKLGTSQDIFSAGTSGTDILYFTSGDALALDRPGATVLTTTQVFRDTSAWYHIVLSVDAANSTNSNKAKLYVNGSEITIFSTDNRSGVGSTSFLTNTATTHRIGVRSSSSSTNPCDMYLADVHLIDGQALTPSSFTEVSATTGQLIPKAYSGTFGTNGFWLKFSDNSAATAAALGNDYSGNNNDWTPNNLSVTAGAGNDSLVDTPTSYGTDTSGVGGVVRGNYCTWNPLNKPSIITLSNGNLDAQLGATDAVQLSTVGMSSGKWYAEITPVSTTGLVFAAIGIAKEGASGYLGQTSTGWGYHQDGRKINSGSASSYGATYGLNDVIGIAFDADNGTLTFYKNNASQGQAYSGLTSGPYFFALGSSQTLNVANFGQRPFAYTAPSGFKALVDTNLPAPLVALPNTLMDVKLYTGNGGTQTISGLLFSPDLVWTKGRSIAELHLISDSVRGVPKNLYPNLTNAEDTVNYLSALTSDGFTVQNQPINNSNGNTYVAWTWDAGTSTVSNTAGSITSQVRANASAGFSVATFNTGSSNGDFTLGHGLGVIPRMIIMKSRTRNGGPWWVYHASTTTDTTKYLELSTTGATITNSGGNIWGSALPTSSLFGFSVGAGKAHTQNEDIVSYCFAPVVGYSSFGSYTGNGSTDGPFVYTGFRPRWVMLKQSSGSGTGWQIHDTSRNTYNVMNNRLQPNNSDAESTYTTSDFLSNGFKLRDSDASWNGNGSTYIYAAFAENPFQFSRAR